MYTITNPKNTLQELKFDFSETEVVEGRISEIAFVTPPKCPELMSAFSRECFRLGKMVSSLTYTKEMAKKRLANRKAVLVIDIIPDKLKEKEIKTSEDVRQAFMDLDPEYSAAYDDLAKTESVLFLAERKLRDMEGALNAVKKVLGETYGIGTRANPYLSVAGESGEVYTSEPTRIVGSLEMGKARY